MKILSVLVEFVLWEVSIVSSLSRYSILVQHACNDRTWLTSSNLITSQYSFIQNQKSCTVLENIIILYWSPHIDIFISEVSTLYIQYRPRALQHYTRVSCVEILHIARKFHENVMLRYVMLCCVMLY